MDFAQGLGAAAACGLLLAAPLASARGAEGEDVPYGVASWPEALGNQRARVHVASRADAVRVHLPWRRRDAHPEEKHVLVVDAATGQTVTNVVRIRIERESGDLVFQPQTAPGEYYFYYMPYSVDPVPWSYKVTYTPPQETADPAWRERSGPDADGLRSGAWCSLPAATVLEFQARSAFHRRDPMEVIATAEETRALLDRFPDRAYLLFPEDRRFPIRMTDDLPQRWIQMGPREEFAGQACRNEFYTFQVGVWAARSAVADPTATCTDLRAAGGATIPASAVRCINLAGTDWLGRPLRNTFAVTQGRVRALWFGVQVPERAPAGEYRGTLTVHPRGHSPASVALRLTVTQEVLADRGDGDLWRLSRLRWLDSTIGLDDEVVRPFTPIRRRGRVLSCLGRRVRFAATGLPESVRSGRREILASPIALVVDAGGAPVAWRSGRTRTLRVSPATVVRETRSTSGPFSLACQVRMEADGHLGYRCALTAREAVRVGDIRLEIPFRRGVAAYMMGMGFKGGRRAPEWAWKWDVNRSNNSLWIGDFDAGLNCKLKGPVDTWDLGSLHASGIPEAWGNGGKGGCNVTEQGPDTVLVRAYSGERELKAGQTLDFCFALLITPVKPLNPDHWRQRYYHFYQEVPRVEDVVAQGATVINIHQGNILNPYINYPFLTTDRLREYVREVHACGARAKIYYTVRELSNFVAEMWPLRSLGFEVFTDGGDGGDSWLREHLVDHYAAAWHQPYPNGEVDAAIATVGLSRWHNYYLEGLSWLIRNVGMDGLYLDGIGYDREIMKRVRKVMDRARTGCLIDFHSGNDYAYMDHRVSPASFYMEHFPYIDSLWFGEMYDYDEKPDYWLVEVSGIPFGLYGEMLQGGGNPWRGMLYGMTNRLGWGGDPRAIWKVWDDFGIQDARMVGYWDPACPARTGREDVLATAYVRKGRTLISLASWAKELVRCPLQVNWRALGLDARRAHLYAPAIPGFQPEALFAAGQPVPVAPGRGWLLIAETRTRAVAPAMDRARGRPVLFEDRFEGDHLAPEWRPQISPRPGTAMRVEGGAVRIEAAANSHAFLERALPAGVSVVQCRAFSGSDGGASWGPGLALVWSDHALKLNLRAEGRFGVDDGAHHFFGGFVAPNSWYHLRIRLEGDEVVAEASADGEFWEAIHTLPRSRYAGDPVAVRVGKLGLGSQAADFAEPGPPGACAVSDVRALGR